MSSVLRPRGPKKAAVYWRRRMVLFAIVLVVPLTIGYLAFGSGQTMQAGAEPTAPQTPAQGGDQGGDQGGEGPDGEPAASPSPTTQGESGSGPVCEDGDIEVVVATDQETYPPDANPQITMTIQNVSGTDCQRNIGSGANEIVVTSGGQHVWSSDDCDPSQAGDIVMLPGDGTKASVTVTWERKLSAPGCAGEAAPAQAGAYQVEGFNGLVAAAPVRIVLR